ncbi:MAG: hypothetical protein WDZ91_14220 [Paenibacillaceae bacterium]
MEIGVNTWVWVSPFRSATFNLLYKIKEMGFDLVEIPVEDPELIDLSKLKQILNDTGLSVSVCGAFGPQRERQGDTRFRPHRLAGNKKCFNGD